jgi:predicted metal-dependent peptidase
MAVLDTSGSIPDEVLEIIDGELRMLASGHDVTVVECDAEIHRVAPYRRLEAVSGRGGTDLRPPLEPGVLRKLRPDIVVYFTDGLGPAPEAAPAVPVIWCLVPGGTEPAEWGQVVRMQARPRHEVDRA